MRSYVEGKANDIFTLEQWENDNDTEILNGCRLIIKESYIYFKGVLEEAKEKLHIPLNILPDMTKEELERGAILCLKTIPENLLS